MKKEFSAEQLLKKYNKGQATPEEIILIESWYLEKGEHMLPYPFPVDYVSKQQGILDKIQLRKSKRVFRLWPRFGIAAAVLLVFGLAAWWLAPTPFSLSTEKVVMKNDIAPGAYGATLILANGQKMMLDSQHNSSSGVVTQKNQSKESNQLVTAKGQTYKLRLSDGTLVWLNATSSLKFPATFAQQGVRRVELNGEAYFEVAKNKKQPFVVETANQTVEVLGTHFNMSSYQDEAQERTTLIEGSVKVLDKKTGHSAQLDPGQQSTVDKHGLAVKLVDTEPAIGWKDGDFVFEGEDFKTALLKISRWYNVEIVIETPLPNNLLPGGWIARHNKLSEVLKLIAASTDLHFEIEGRKVTIRN